MASKAKHEFKAEMKQLLHLIIHSLYTDKEIFLRELISNSSDALNKVRLRQLTDKKNLLDESADLKISISLNEETGELSIEDSGIGMTEDDLVNRLGTVASSGTQTLLEELKDGKTQLDANLIGQFGVGFYSVFMVTKKVTVETRHADKDSKAYRWTSKGEGTFTVEEIEKESRGTKISFKLNKDDKEFAQAFKAKSIIRRYSNFVDFPIFLGDEEVNTSTALWRKGKSDVSEDELKEFYSYISHDHGEFLDHLHLDLEGRISFKAMLFIPGKAPFNMFRTDELPCPHLYANRVYIQDNCKELVPDYLKFLRGVVDTDSLPLNVSREVTQRSPVLAKIREAITGKTLSLLESWAKKDPEKLKQFYTEFGTLFKSGINSEFKHRDRIIELLRFESNIKEAGELVGFNDYVDRMPSDREEIYYLTGTDRDSLESNPNLEYFQENGIEVLLLTEPVDAFIIPSIGTYKEKKLLSAESASLDLASSAATGDSLSEDDSEKMVKLFTEVLGDKVAGVNVSKRLVASAVTLVSAEGMDLQTERLMKMMNQDFEGSKKTLEINPSHPVLLNLAKRHKSDPKDAIVAQSISQLFEGAQLISGELSSPGDFVTRMTEFIEKATS